MALTSIRKIRPSAHAASLHRYYFSSIPTASASSSTSSQQLPPHNDPSAPTTESILDEASTPKKKKARPSQKTTTVERTGTSAPLDKWIDRSRNYLATLDNAPPTLEYLTSLKPSTDVTSMSPRSQRYLTIHSRLTQTIHRSFDKSQLNTFCRELGIPKGISASKQHAVRAIMRDAWHMPEPVEPLAAAPSVEVAMQLSMGQLFLLLGRDGSDLLRLGAQYEVHIKPTMDPVGIFVKGEKSKVKGLQQRLLSWKASVLDETFQATDLRGITSQLTESISRAAGAYVQADSDGKITVMAEHLSRISAVKRLGLQAAFEDQKSFIIPVIVHSQSSVGSKSGQCALYPSLGSSSPHWMHSSSSLFRMRKVGGWWSEDLSHSHPSGLGKHSNTLAIKYQEIQKALISGIGEQKPGSQRLVSARTGHITTVVANHKTLVPPLLGSHPGPELLSTLKANGNRMVFVHSAPVKPSPANESATARTHRLVYRLLSASEPPSGMPPVSAVPVETLMFDVTQVYDPQSPPLFAKTVREPEISIQCKIGQEAFVEIALPERSSDLQLSVMDYTDLAQSDLPTDISAYSRQLKRFLQEENSPNTTSMQLRRPDPPNQFHHNGLIYHLTSHLTVEDTTGAVSTLGSVEKITDIDAGNTVITSKLQCDDSFDPNSWLDFIHACDRISSNAYTLPTHTPSFSLHLDS